jgi:IS30 family transposase
VRELAMRRVGLAPLLGEGKDLADLPLEQAVDGAAAAAAVGEVAGQGALRPAAGAPLVQAEDAARPLMRPATRDGVLEQPQQRDLHSRVDARGDRAYQPERCFPRSTTSSIACSLTVSANRSISNLAAASSASSAAPRAPGRDCAKALNAPARATLRIRMIVVGSTPQRSAASRCVVCPASSSSQTCSFSSALNDRLRRRDPLPFFTSVVLSARMTTRRHGVIIARNPDTQSDAGDEREEISRGLARGDSCRQIAAELGRSHATISREVRQGGGSEGYRALDADRDAWERAHRPKSARLAGNARLRAVVDERLESKWSPEQIAASLRRAYPEDEQMRVSHETIYLSLFVRSRRALRHELTGHLRSGRGTRRPRASRPASRGQGQLSGKRMIRDRPAEVEDRAVAGHWEGDLLLGKRPSGIATLVERSSRYTRLVALPEGYRAEPVRVALAGVIAALPAELRRSLTWDQGKEMAEHARFTNDTGVSVYFCEPRSPWQRGTNEKTNGLLRQYFPKRSDLRITQGHLDAGRCRAQRAATQDAQLDDARGEARAADRGLNCADASRRPRAPVGPVSMVVVVDRLALRRSAALPGPE